MVDGMWYDGGWVMSNRWIYDSANRDDLCELEGRLVVQDEFAKVEIRPQQVKGWNSLFVGMRSSS
jgi:hypothetical protein